MEKLVRIGSRSRNILKSAIRNVTSTLLFCTLLFALCVSAEAQQRAKPGELPIERPMKFEFVVNVKTLKQLRLSITPNVLARADRVIK